MSIVKYILDICWYMILYDILYVFLLSKSHKTTSSLPAMPPGEYVRQERRAGGTGTSRSGREATEAPAMPLATLTNMGIGPTIGPTNKEWQIG